MSRSIQKKSKKRHCRKRKTARDELSCTCSLGGLCSVQCTDCNARPGSLCRKLLPWRALGNQRRCQYMHWEGTESMRSILTTRTESNIHLAINSTKTHLLSNNITSQVRLFRDLFCEDILTTEHCLFGTSCVDKF